MRKIKPIRKIVPSLGSTRGQVSSLKNERLIDYESELEKDFFLLLEFDYKIRYYCEQPVEIEYFHDGIQRTYTPDALVEYISGTNTPPTLIEVKYTKDLQKHKDILTPKFNAAKKYCLNKGWSFEIMTEKEIRTPYLENIKFLLPYKRIEDYVESDYLLLVSALSKKVYSTPYELIHSVEKLSDGRKAELLYCLWHLIATGCVSTDLTQPLTMKSEIYIKS